ncbi:acyltransferase [Vibrio aestuarianus]|uniref:acyltransferase n=1 Tax=Vibrio aestuarianus TaxID=28171 RepID=UPI00237D056A|nr:acyltransferase family protein [Vibrio aestuarianus]MDE1328932.1 acyltransferase family protein [Vibrio aestuarianus]
MSSSQKIASLELGRVIAILAVIALHCQMFLSYFTYQDEPWFGYVFNQLTRFAVPLFFLISGYLIQPKLVASPIVTLKRYARPLFRLWVVWSVLCLLVPFNWPTVAQDGYLAERIGYWDYWLSSPLDALLEGGLVHLWFIPALIFAVAILAWLLQTKRTNLIIPLAVALYIYGVLAGSYQAVTELSAPFFTRNGPFFSTLLVSIGFMIRQHTYQLSAAKACVMLSLGLLMHLAEAYALHPHDQLFNANDYLFTTPLWATGCFLLLLAKPNWGNSPWVFALSQRILGVYVSHLLVAISMMNIAGILALQDGMRDLFVFTGTVIFTLLLVIGIEKTPLRSILLR